MIRDKILITGGAGYVGSKLVPYLLKKGKKVKVYDLFIYGNNFRDHPNLELIEGDIRDKEHFDSVLEDVNSIIHLASISNDPSFELNPKLGKSINYDSVFILIDLVRKHKIERLIVASSTSQYGIHPKSVEVTEETKSKPITDYAKYKLKYEEEILKSNLNETCVTFLRPATLSGYSPRLRLDLVVNLFIINAIENKKIKVYGGEQIRPTLHIDDMVRAYYLILTSPKEKINGQAFNVAGSNLTVHQIALCVKDCIKDSDIELEVTPTDDLRSYHVDSSKIKEQLGFVLGKGIKDSIKELLEAHKSGKIIDGLNNPKYYNIKRMKEINLK